MKYRERLLLWESEGGRTFGWDVELDGKRIVVLVRPREVDMFWASYEVQECDVAIAAPILGMAFWIENDSRLVFRNRVVKGAVANSVVVGRINVEERRITFRGLYADMTGARWWDRMVLMSRRLWRGMVGWSV